jgi:hypothetical protein
MVRAAAILDQEVGGLCCDIMGKKRSSQVEKPTLLIIEWK